MENNYDENLSDNQFYRQLQLDHSILLETAPLEGWIICVPRTGVIDNGNVNLSDPELLLAHILISHDELPETHYTNLIGNTVKLVNKKLKVYDSGDNNRVKLEVNILFEEIFYTTKEMLKYKVWCIDTPLFKLSEEDGDDNNHDDKQTLNNKTSTKVRYHDNPTTTVKKTQTNNHLYTVNNFRDALQLLWTETKSKIIFKKIQRSVNQFIRTNAHPRINRSGGGGDGNCDGCARILNLKKNVHQLFHRCLDVVIASLLDKKKYQNDSHFQVNVNIAVETFMMNLLYNFIFDVITVVHQEDTQTFNKTIRKLYDLSLFNYEIDPELNNLIPAIRDELAKIGSFTTILDKLRCLKTVMNVVKKNRTLSMDDFLPILVFSIIKTEITHWIPNLIFLQEFQFCDTNFGGDNFLVTTLEAAITFIQTDETMTNLLNFDYKRNNDDGDGADNTTEDDEKSLKLDRVFEEIINENESEVRKFYSNPIYEPDSEMCHPLCDCNRCEERIERRKLNVNDSNRSSGLTALHISAMYGIAKVLNLLISLGASVNQMDKDGNTPLHYSALRGHQNTLLLLLHAGANINAMNVIDRNTPLHIAALYGHQNCVKAILYFADHMKIKLNQNLQNLNGDTPLHLASQWGYLEIIETMLEYNANVDLINQNGCTALEVAHNSLIENRFKFFNRKITRHFERANFNENYKFDKIINAISGGDINLALFYLGVESNLLE